MLSKFAWLVLALLFSLTLAQQGGGESGGGGDSGGESGGGGDSGESGGGETATDTDTNDFDPNADLECNYLEFTIGTAYSYAMPTSVCFAEYDDINGTYSYYQYVCGDDGETVTWYSYSDSECTLDETLVDSVTGSTQEEFVTITAHCGYTDNCGITVSYFYTEGESCSSSDWSYYMTSGMVGGYCYQSTFDGTSYAIACESDGTFTHYNFTQSSVCAGDVYTTSTDADYFGIENCEFDAEDGVSGYGEIDSTSCDTTFTPYTDTSGSGSGDSDSDGDSGGNNDSSVITKSINLALFAGLCVLALIVV